MTNFLPYQTIYEAYLWLLALLLLFFFTFKLYRLAKPQKDREFERPKKPYEPRVLVIVPCKGMDITLEANLGSIMGQKYKNFNVVAVVDSIEDPAMEAIKNVGMNYIVSSRKYPTASGKVRAISTAIRKFGDYEVYVVADSDILAEDYWLSLLIRPLADLNTGIVTTFPRFEPVGGFWSEVKMVWGFVGQGMMGSNITRFAWGGSMAFRKDLFDYGPYFKRFCVALSDDIALTRIAREKELKIEYVKAAMPKVNSADGFSTFWEWSNRQTALSILGNRKLFGIGILFYGLQALLFISGMALGIVTSPIFFVLLLPTFLALAQDIINAGSITLAVIIASIVMPFIYLTNLMVGKSMKSISWRGSNYSLFQI